MKISTKKNKSRNKLLVRIGAFFIAVFLIVIVPILIFTGIYFKNIKTTYTEAILGKNDFLTAQASLQDQNFAQTATSLSSARMHFETSAQSFNKVPLIRKVPIVKTQVLALDNVLLAGTNMADAMEELALLGEEIIKVAKVEGEETSFGKIGKEKKEAILKKIYNSPEKINEAKIKLEEAVVALDNIPKKGLIKPLKTALAPIEENIPLIKQLIDKGVPALEVLPAVAGYPETKTYLFLLQNNTEIRPTGGFIGTYGILKVKNADIELFQTDNIYNLDNKAKNSVYVDPPEPLAKYLGSSQWLLRDANWSPDYPTTAIKAEEFYHLENGSEENIDGIIAITPLFIEDLLKLTGPITVDGEEFNEDNFIDKLQFKVEFGYVQEGLSDADRKDVIGQMSSILMTRMLDLPKDKWSDLWQVFVENVEEKQILLYMEDDKLEQYIEELNWDGRIKDVTFTGRDFLMLVDANLAALKTDKVMERNLDYSVSKEGDDLIATLQVHYKNNGTFTNMTTRYRSYTRIFVPRGSELISSDGFYTNDRYLGGEPTPALVKQDEEFNKTIFEGFISVEPQSEQVVTLKYKLPQEIKDMVSNNKYDFYWQKQSGSESYPCTFNIDIGEKVDQGISLDLSPEIDDNRVQFKTDLKTDRYFQILYK
jgi:hypothetical protein